VKFEFDQEKRKMKEKKVWELNLKSLLGREQRILDTDAGKQLS
jgi:hypothetical protein